MNRTDCLHIYI